MCGIAAIAGKNLNAQPHDMAAALTALNKRGPDCSGTMRFGACILGHTRLSIIDITGGTQPMKDTEKDIAVAFNGEIYNYKELRAKMEQKGHRFRTQSDTEVILKAYIEYGEDCAKHLDGMFAFALWDNENQLMYVARDRFGKKPLYYANDKEGNIVVASEIKALLAMGIKGEIDPAAINDYLTLMYIPPWKSVYKNIHVLLPAHQGVAKNGTLSTNRYWQLPVAPTNPTYDEAKTEIERLFTESIRKRMIADVEIGSFLSGGVDSTLVTAYAQRISTHPLKTFSVGYGEHINELPFAKEASDTIGTDHHTLEVTGDLMEELEKTLAYFDEPHADSSDFAQHMVSELASKHVKVALSGDGADELFLGYGWYWSYWHTRKIVYAKNILLSSPYKQHLRNATVFPSSMRRRLFINPAHATDGNIGQLAEELSGSGIQKMNYFDITTYLPGQLLSKVDQTSMMHGLEVRCPFLDYQLAEYVFNLPEHFKTDHSRGKIILKDILEEIMPKEFVHRGKQGFGAPVRKWLEEPQMQSYIENKLKSGAYIYTYLKEAEVQKFMKEVFGSKNPKGYYQLWVLLCLELWLSSHLHA